MIFKSYLILLLFYKNGKIVKLLGERETSLVTDGLDIFAHSPTKKIKACLPPNPKSVEASLRIFICCSLDTNGHYLLRPPLMTAELGPSILSSVPPLSFFLLPFFLFFFCKSLCFLINLLVGMIPGFQKLDNAA